MKKWLADRLICPDCLTEEIPLDLEVKEAQLDDLLEGELTCPACKRCYQIHKGVAVVLPEKSMPVVLENLGYNTPGMLSSYLWSHYSDLFEDPQATDAYRIWASHLRNINGYALDIGCAVGRLSFELSKSNTHVIGIDTSISFIRKARELLKARELTFDLIIEGLITEERSCTFDGQWNFDRIDFLVADALALPFPRSMFSTVTSVNILEKVSSPIDHLIDINRVLREENAMFMFSDPFSWDESVSHPESWLGGKTYGTYPGRGIDTIARLFSGQDKIFDPPLEITARSNVSWKIRKTENLWEHINSQFIIGNRE